MTFFAAHEHDRQQATTKNLAAFVSGLERFADARSPDA
jgi:hypothetical protein